MSLEQRWSRVNPYPEDTPKSLLERVVQVPDYAWNNAWTGTELKLLTAFLTVSNIHQSILGSFSESMYRFLQCGFKVTIRINSTPFHQGALVVSWCPDNYQTVNVPGGLLGYASMENTVILSASQQDQVTLDIPYFSLNPHYDLAFPREWIDTRVNIKVLNPLLTSSSSVVDTVPVSVFIQMTNVHTYGILDPDTLRLTEKPVRKTNFEKQSSKSKQNTEAQAKDAIGETAKGVISLVKPVLSSIPLVSDVLSFGKNLFANLDKPSSDQAVQYTTTRPHRGHAHLTGLDYSESLSSFPSYQTSKETELSSSDMNITKYCSIPALFYSTTITTKGVVLKVAVHPAKYSSSYRSIDYPDYLAFGSQFFRYYRGSVKYLVQFVGTPFYSCRFKLSVVHSLNLPPGGTGTGTGFMSKVVDVKGDAWTSFVVPYLGCRMWSYTTFDADPVPDVPYFILEALTDVQGSSLPADAIYYVNIWRAAGPDFQLAMQTTVNQDWTPPAPEVKKTNFVKQSALAQKWNEPSQPIKEGATGILESGTYMADQSTTITDMCKRFVPHLPGMTGPFTYPSDWDSSALVPYPIFLFTSSFLFWKGSRRFKTGPGNLMYAAVQRTQVSTPIYGNAVVLGSNIDAAPPVTIPWYHNELFYTTTIARHDYNPTPWTMPVDMVIAGISGQFWIAAGDDFGYYYLVPPNPKSVLASSVKLVTKLDEHKTVNNSSINPDDDVHKLCNARKFEQI